MSALVAGEIEFLERNAEHVVAELVISPEEAVFAGHYPEYPIFPGVCVLECVRRVAEESTDAVLRWEAVDSSRFMAAVHPGDRVRVALRWIVEDDFARAKATVRCVEQDVATLRLRYRRGEES